MCKDGARFSGGIEVHVFFFPKQSLAVGVLAVLVEGLVDLTGHRAPSGEANSL